MWIKEKSSHARRSLVRCALNPKNKLTLFDILQLIVSLSGVCTDIKIEVVATNEYNIKCIDMFSNLALEFFIVVHNPALKPVLVRIFTMIQDAVREREKAK
jgi:hypothetical protein